MLDQPTQRPVVAFLRATSPKLLCRQLRTSLKLHNRPEWEQIGSRSFSLPASPPGRGCVKTILRRRRPRKTRTRVQLLEAIARKTINQGALMQSLFSRPEFSHGLGTKETLSGPSERSAFDVRFQLVDATRVQIPSLIGPLTRAGS